MDVIPTYFVLFDQRQLYPTQTAKAMLNNSALGWDVKFDVSAKLTEAGFVATVKFGYMTTVGPACPSKKQAGEEACILMAEKLRESYPTRIYKKGGEYEDLGPQGPPPEDDSPESPDEEEDVWN